MATASVVFPSLSHILGPPLPHCTAGVLVTCAAHNTLWEPPAPQQAPSVSHLTHSETPHRRRPGCPPVRRVLRTPPRPHPHRQPLQLARLHGAPGQAPPCQQHQQWAGSSSSGSSSARRPLPRRDGCRGGARGGLWVARLSALLHPLTIEVRLWCLGQHQADHNPPPPPLTGPESPAAKSTSGSSSAARRQHG